ncbi:MAG: molybdenum cofactor biosynthesis protein MoaE [Candidatus Schekmanbacteria bacterium]|nr:molybdenum cofactor biosynthesis protein MoaE [Candidatus Schekmanbacteria bacterium]
MRVTVLFFGFYRDLLGRSSETLEIPGDRPVVSDLWEVLVRTWPVLSTRWSMTRFAVDREHVGGDGALREGAEVAIFPPLAGGAGETDAETEVPARFHVGLTREPIQLEALRRAVASPAAGAVVEFIGVVRNRHRGKVVQRLAYEAYEPMAAAELDRLGRDLRQRHDLEGIAIMHRLGPLAIGEEALAIVVSAPHRAAAFAACREAIERIKELVPIFKREIYADGTASWVGAEESGTT